MHLLFYGGTQIKLLHNQSVESVLRDLSIRVSSDHFRGDNKSLKFCLFTARQSLRLSRIAQEHPFYHSRLANWYVLVTENFVSLRYTATGSHNGGPHNGIPPTRRKAQWTAAGNFIIDEETGLIQHWWKDWDKMQSAFLSCISTCITQRCSLCSVEATWLGEAR